VEQRLKYQWIADLIAKEFPEIVVTSDTYSHGQNVELCLMITANGESIRQTYEIETLYLEDSKGRTFRPDAFMINIGGDWEYFMQEDMKRKPQTFEENKENIAKIRHWCMRLLYWRDWSKDALAYKIKRLKEKGLPFENVKLYEPTEF